MYFIVKHKYHIPPVRVSFSLNTSFRSRTFHRKSFFPVEVRMIYFTSIKEKFTISALVSTCGHLPPTQHHRDQVGFSSWGPTPPCRLAFPLLTAGEYAMEVSHHAHLGRFFLTVQNHFAGNESRCRESPVLPMI